MRTATVTIYADGMGPESSEQAYTAWTTYVADRIDEMTGLDVTIDDQPYGTAGYTHVTADTTENERNVHDAIQTLWNRWCAEGWPGAGM